MDRKRNFEDNFHSVKEKYLFVKIRKGGIKMEKFDWLTTEIKAIMDENKLYPIYMKMHCSVCGNEFGIRLDPGRRLTNRDLTCRKCLFEKYVS
jgi:hypothetical protein